MISYCIDLNLKKKKKILKKRFKDQREYKKDNITVSLSFFKKNIFVELTALCLDDRERKFVIADHNGFVGVYDYLNGALMKEFEYNENGRAHNDEITKMIYCNDYKWYFLIVFF